MKVLKRDQKGKNVPKTNPQVTLRVGTRRSVTGEISKGITKTRRCQTYTIRTHVSNIYVYTRIFRTNHKRLEGPRYQNTDSD